MPTFSLIDQLAWHLLSMLHRRIHFPMSLRELAFGTPDEYLVSISRSLDSENFEKKNLAE
jgi:hypothetical protein